MEGAGWVNGQKKGNWTIGAVILSVEENKNIENDNSGKQKYWYTKTEDQSISTLAIIQNRRLTTPISGLRGGCPSCYQPQTYQKEANVCNCLDPIPISLPLYPFSGAIHPPESISPYWDEYPARVVLSRTRTVSATVSFPLVPLPGLYGCVSDSSSRLPPVHRPAALQPSLLRLIRL